MFRSRRNNWDPAGKTVIIVGGTRGLGLELGRQLASLGARLAICSRDQARVDVVQSEFSASGAQVLALTCDVVDPQQVKSFIDVVRNRFERIDAVINCAGVLTVGPAIAHTTDDYRKSLDVMLLGPVTVNAAVLPHMLDHRQGLIVNIGSIGGEAGIPRLNAYSSAKAGLHAYSQGLTVELAPLGVRVITVIPGLMRTGAQRNGRFKGDHRAEYAWFSLVSSLPVWSVNTPRAARSIIRAMRRGQRELLIGPSARLSSVFMRYSHWLTRFGLSWMHRLLPGHANMNREASPGFKSTSGLSESFLTKSSRDGMKIYGQLEPFDQQQGAGSAKEPTNRSESDQAA